MSARPPHRERTLSHRAGHSAPGAPPHARAHDAAARTADPGDDGTDGLLVSQVIRTGEFQAWVPALGRHSLGAGPIRPSEGL
ncbi:hypothetical protein [Streptomyces eurythermus]